jgi:methionyl-tRNA formyltransferase
LGAGFAAPWLHQHPRLAAAAPIHRAIEAGDAQTGITIMQMDAGLDTGDMLLVESLPIAAAETTATLQDMLAALGGRLIVEVLEAAACGSLVPRIQPEAGVNYAHKIDKAEARIDWGQPAALIERRIRAFDPQPGCHFEHEGEQLKVWRAQVVSGLTGEPGATRLEPHCFAVACGDGAALDLLEVQRPGGRRQPVAAFLAARRG